MSVKENVQESHYPHRQCPIYGGKYVTGVNCKFDTYVKVKERSLSILLHSTQQGQEFPFGNSRESGIPKIPGCNSREFLNSRREFPKSTLIDV